MSTSESLASWRGDGTEDNRVDLLVMGVTGAGKSTFISIATGDESIPVGENLDSVTKECAEYILYDSNYEIHLIDSPGFDDATARDDEVLQRVAAWINNVYMLKQTGAGLAGILYLHDITRPRMNSGGESNIRMLEEMVGKDKWENITLVTTKWHCSLNHDGELQREKTLQMNDKFWKSMRESSHKASMKRFIGTKESALDIIRPHLNNNFAPAITEEMVMPGGPYLALGETKAGRVIQESVEKRLRSMGKYKELQDVYRTLQQKFDDQAFQSFLLQREDIIKRQRRHRVGRWGFRLAMTCGAVVATVLTESPAAGRAIIAAGGAMESVWRQQKVNDQAALAAHDKGYMDVKRTWTERRKRT